SKFTRTVDRYSSAIEGKLLQRIKYVYVTLNLVLGKRPSRVEIETWSYDREEISRYERDIRVVGNLATIGDPISDEAIDPNNPDNQLSGTSLADPYIPLSLRIVEYENIKGDTGVLLCFNNMLSSLKKSNLRIECSWPSLKLIRRLRTLKRSKVYCWRRRIH
ncbi:MAG: hypothetical protein ACPGYT_10900, partial [Nitrospirales bacterium]